MKFPFAMEQGSQAKQSGRESGNFATELQERLAGPNADAVRAEVAQRLAATLARVEGRMRSGLSRKAYQQADTVSRALKAARDFVARRPSRLGA